MDYFRWNENSSPLAKAGFALGGGIAASEVLFIPFILVWIRLLVIQTKPNQTKPIKSIKSNS